MDTNETTNVACISTPVTCSGSAPAADFFFGLAWAEKQDDPEAARESLGFSFSDFIKRIS